MLGERFSGDPGGAVIAIGRDGCPMNDLLKRIYSRIIRRAPEYDVDIARLFRQRGISNKQAVRKRRRIRGKNDTQADKTVQNGGLLLPDRRQKFKNLRRGGSGL
jgi:hypothetical protein